MKKVLLMMIAVAMMAPTMKAQTKDNVARECVLFELFTGVNCPYCPAAANGVAQMLDEGLAIAPVAYHTTAFSTAPYYTNETNARANYYNISSYPTLKADGVLNMSGGGNSSQSNYTSYRNLYNQRVNQTSPFRIELTYEPVEGATCRVNCTVTQVGDCSGNDVRVFIALTQCNIDVSWQGMNGLHHVCRDMIPTQTGTPFTGPTMTLNETFEMNWPKEDCYLTAWVQNYSGNREVYQAVRLSTALDLDYDLGLSKVDNVTTQNCSGMQKPQFVVKNLGHQEVTSFEMCVSDGKVEQRQSWQGNLPSGETVVVDMNEIMTEPEGELQFYVIQPNGNEDGFMADNYRTVGMEDVFVIDGYVKMQLKTGAHPENTIVEIKDMTSGELIEHFIFEQPNKVYSADINLLNAGCYRIEVRDEAGEGMGNGFFQFIDANSRILLKGGGAAGHFTYALMTEVDCDGTVAVGETQAPGPIVYPNPSHGLFHLDLGQGQWQVAVFDLTGKKVMESLHEGHTTLDLSSQPKGMYFIKAQQNGIEFNAKIVVE